MCMISSAFVAWQAPRTNFSEDVSYVQHMTFYDISYNRVELNAEHIWF